MPLARGWPASRLVALWALRFGHSQKAVFDKPPQTHPAAVFFHGLGRALRTAVRAGPRGGRQKPRQPCVATETSGRAPDREVVLSARTGTVRCCFYAASLCCQRVHSPAVCFSIDAGCIILLFWRGHTGHVHSAWSPQV